MSELESIVREYFQPNDTWLDTYTTMNPVWVAHVKFPNSTEVCEITDDYERPNCMNSWLRLKTLVEQNGLFLVRFLIRWRKKRLLVVENTAGVFFSRKVGADATTQQNFKFFLTGGIYEDIIAVQEWELPVLQLVGQEIRKVNETKPEFIIWNTCMIQSTPITK